MPLNITRWGNQQSHCFSRFSFSLSKL